MGQLTFQLLMHVKSTGHVAKLLDNLITGLPEAVRTLRQRAAEQAAFPAE